MTRSRAVTGNVPNPLAPVYYAQRAQAGLIISEATQVSRQGTGYIRTPGIYSLAQVEAWRRVTDAVHEAGELFLRNYGMSDAFRILSSMMVSFRLPHLQLMQRQTFYV